VDSDSDSEYWLSEASLSVDSEGVNSTTVDPVDETLLVGEEWIIEPSVVDPVCEGWLVVDSVVVEPGEGVISIEEEDSRSLLSGEGVLIVSVNMDASGGTSTGAVRGEVCEIKNASEVVKWIKPFLYKVKAKTIRFVVSTPQTLGIKA
jgi:hypothetical protein